MGVFKGDGNDSTTCSKLSLGEPSATCPITQVVQQRGEVGKEFTQILWIKNKAVPRNTKKQSYIVVVLLTFLSGLLYFSKPLSCSRSPPFVQRNYQSQNIAWSRGSELWFVSHQAIPRPRNRLCCAISTHPKKMSSLGIMFPLFCQKKTHSIETASQK